MSSLPYNEIADQTGGCWQVFNIINHPQVTSGITLYNNCLQALGPTWPWTNASCAGASISQGPRLIPSLENYYTQQDPGAVPMVGDLAACSRWTIQDIYRKTLNRRSRLLLEQLHQTPGFFQTGLASCQVYQYDQWILGQCTNVCNSLKLGLG